MLESMIVTSVIRMLIKVLAPEGVKFIQEHDDEAIKNVKLYINEHVPPRWLAEPLEDIVDAVFPVVVQVLIKYLENADEIHLAALTNTVLDETGEEAMAKVQQRLSC